MTLPHRTAQKRPLSRHVDELNLARLSLISMQSRVGPTSTSWEDHFEENGQAVSVKCIGTSQYLVPHGIDNDLIIGILSLFAAAGYPENNAVTCTANRLLRAAGLDTSGRYHKSLHESLMRLSHTNFHIERGWHDGGRFRTVIFRHVHEIVFDTAESGGAVDQDSQITIVLPPAIAESLRRGFIKPLNSQMLGELHQPPARALYRLLDGHRHDLHDPSVRLGQLEVNLVEWGRKARILDLRPDKIRRVLDAAQDELIRVRYLSNVAYEGRGQAQTITYTFAHELEQIDPALLDRLAVRGIAPKVARDLLSTFGRATVRDRLDEAERLVAGKKIPGAGFFVSFIRAPEDYRHRFTPAIQARVQQPRLLERPVEEDPNQVIQRRLEGMTVVERAQDTVRALKVAYGSRLSGAQYEALRENLEVEALDAGSLRAAAAQALAGGHRDTTARELSVLLAGLQ
ncbi:replication initiator protein A [Deinococcus aquatilis]|uniref:replication initiator protein A n=1 Tax=Deinococcus aquatilis TaxID=519440 RepID=UPI00035C5C2D|nr:replication initiator protein A [Deinococcus aquatilis]